MGDPTEGVRRALVAEINADPASREALEAAHGQVWDTGQLTEDFDVHGFLAPFISVTRSGGGVSPNSDVAAERAAVP